MSEDKVIRFFDKSESAFKSYTSRSHMHPEVFEMPLRMWAHSAEDIEYIKKDNKPFKVAIEGEEVPLEEVQKGLLNIVNFYNGDEEIDEHSLAVIKGFVRQAYEGGFRMYYEKCEF